MVCYFYLKTKKKNIYDEFDNKKIRVHLFHSKIKRINNKNTVETNIWLKCDWIQSEIIFISNISAEFSFSETIVIESIVSDDQGYSSDSTTILI